jgi:hypothetical protein
MIQIARNLKPVTLVPAPVVRLPTRPPRDAVPVILRATKAEAFGAAQRVGGLRVVDRAIRQLGKLRDARVTLVSDGSVRLPRRLPANMELHEISGDADRAVAALAAELGSETATVSADSVWLLPRRFDKGIRIVDRASRAAAGRSLCSDLEQEPGGIVDRLLYKKITARVTFHLLSRLPVTPVLLTLAACLLGLYGALLVAMGSENVLVGFGVLAVYTIARACANALARLRLHRSDLTSWLDSVGGDLVGVAVVLAVGLATWRGGGSLLDMKMALVAGGLNVISSVVIYQELLRQHESDVTKVRWWFAHGQSLRLLTGAGSRSIKVVLMLGRQDLVMLAGLGLACLDQLPVALLYMLIVAMARAGGALGQLLTPRWRLRPPA